MRQAPAPRRAHAVPLPDESAIAHLYPGADLADAFAIAIPREAMGDIEALAHVVLASPSRWFVVLLGIRDAIMRRFGVKTSGELHAQSARGGRDTISFFQVRSRSAGELIFGDDDRHLDFRGSLLLRASGDAGHEAILTTVVHCHNLLGRIYLQVISPFHRIIVRDSLNRAAQKGFVRESLAPRQVSGM